jgi:hypothetical protein
MISLHPVLTAIDGFVEHVLTDSVCDDELWISAHFTSFNVKVYFIVIFS